MMAWMVADDMRAKQLLRKQTKLDGAGMAKATDKYMGRRVSRQAIGRQEADKRHLRDTLLYLVDRITDGGSWITAEPRRLPTLDVRTIATPDLINAFDSLSPSARGLVPGELVLIADPFTLTTRAVSDDLLKLIGKIMWPLNKELYMLTMAEDGMQGGAAGSVRRRQIAQRRAAEITERGGVPAAVIAQRGREAARADAVDAGLAAAAEVTEAQGLADQGAGAAAAAATTDAQRRLARRSRGVPGRTGRARAGRARAGRGGNRGAGAQSRRKRGRRQLFADVEELYLCGKVNALRF
jgi:hypothetical protein